MVILSWMSGAAFDSTDTGGSAASRPVAGSAPHAESAARSANAVPVVSSVSRIDAA